MLLKSLKKFEINILNSSTPQKDPKNGRIKTITDTYWFTSSLKGNMIGSYTRNQSKLQNGSFLIIEFKKLLQPTRDHGTLWIRSRNKSCQLQKPSNSMASLATN